MTTITNDDGDIVTRINVMQVISYDVEQIVTELLEELLEDMHADDAVVTLDDVLERIEYLAGEQFGYKVVLSYQDENGNDY